MNRLTKWGALALLAALASGCVGQPMRIDDVPNTGSLDIGQGRPLTASASGFQLFCLIPIQVNDRHERAYQAVQRQAGGDALGDVSVSESWTYAFVGTLYTTEVRAMAYPRKGMR